MSFKLLLAFGDDGANALVFKLDGRMVGVRKPGVWSFKILDLIVINMASQIQIYLHTINCEFRAS
jgi:hypothetical protein